jgi:hypothetical protein
MNKLGLSLMEVLIAIVALAITLVALNTMMTSNIVQNASTGKLTQAIQLVNYLGRRVTGGDASVLPTPVTPLTWNYGNLRTNFSDLPQGANFGNPDHYKARITNRGTWSSAAANNIVLAQYRIEVCWRTGEGERCTQADTLAIPNGNNEAEIGN